MPESRAAAPRIAVLDANVLFPFSPRDVLLWAAWVGVYQPRWSAEILDEARRSLLALGQITAGQADHFFQQMQLAFPEATVTGYEPLIGLMTTDAADRHVAAAGVHAHAQVLVTQNRRHFPDEALRPHGLRAVDADTFLEELLGADPPAVKRAVERMARARRKPARTVADILNELEWGVPVFCGRARRLLNQAQESAR